MPPKDNPVNLRGHHLICIHTFLGEGYSKAFSENMGDIVRILKVPTQKIRIVEGLDHICTFCPYSNWVSCLKGNDKVMDMDKKVVSILGIEPRGTYKSLYLRLKTGEAVHKGLFCDVCAKCEWFALYCRPLLCSG